MGNWNFANILTNQASKTLLLLGVLPHFSKFHWFYIVKTYKWGSISNSRTVPHQFRPWRALGHLGGIRDGHKTWGTVRELDIEPCFWIFTYLTWQKPRKWGKTGKSMMLKKCFLSPRNLKNGVPSWYYYINFPKNAPNPKSGILAIYACGHTVQCALGCSIYVFENVQRVLKSIIRLSFEEVFLFPTC